MLQINQVKPSLKYRRIKRLGQGNFAEVILVEDLQAKQVKFVLRNPKIICYLFEIKALKKIILNGSEDLNLMLNEVRLLQNCAHPNIIKCFNFYRDYGRLYIEMAYCEEGNTNFKI